MAQKIASKRRPALTARKPTARSSVTNGKQLLANIDGRSPEARRYRDILAALAADRGGFDALSEAKLHLCRRLVEQVILAERLGSMLIRGEEIDVEQHCLISNTIGRLATRIGLGRAMKNVPALRDYLSATPAERQQLIGEDDDEQDLSAATDAS